MEVLGLKRLIVSLYAALASECYEDKPQLELYTMNGCNMSEAPHFGSDGLTLVGVLGRSVQACLQVEPT